MAEGSGPSAVTEKSRPLRGLRAHLPAAKAKQQMQEQYDDPHQQAADSDLGDQPGETWRHLNLFQHHCYIHAAAPRVNCPEHGVRLIEVPWARKGSAFTLLFKQVR